MTDQARQQHAVLMLAAIRCEALTLRLSDREFRHYVRSITSSLDLPDPATDEEVPHAA